MNHLSSKWPGVAGHRATGPEMLALSEAGGETLQALADAAAETRDRGHGDCISYSRNVFIPLTKLCRDVCHYCTFSRVSPSDENAFMTPKQVLDIARRGAASGCKEALFTLGEKPELRYETARRALADLGHDDTISYLVEMADMVRRETGLLVHVNPGTVSAADLSRLREVSVSQGMMLESLADRLCERGGPHFGSPDKAPAARLATIKAAGELKIPYTSGLLIGIGETRAERIEALLALRDLHDTHGHIQELILQNFKPKPGTPMARHPEPSPQELIWTIAVARLLFGPDMNIQAPPNLLPDRPEAIIGAGINDWGGVSPVTQDFVNPEAPWPHLDALARDTARSGKILVERLTAYPHYVLQASDWQSKSCAAAVAAKSDSEGLARNGEWRSGRKSTRQPHLHDTMPLIGGWTRSHPPLHAVLDRAQAGKRLNEEEVTTLLTARGTAADLVCHTADALRRDMCGDTVSYVVNRNINYTNICAYKCTFCAFSKGKKDEALRGKPYLHGANAVVAMAADGVANGAKEVCLQGGIHPQYTGDTYLEHCSAIRSAFPDLHIHAFSPLEIWQGAQTNSVSVREFLLELKAAGLGSLPGTSAEILDDEVRAIICPDKLDTQTWLSVVETAHELDIPTTATIMFGHVERPHHIARHLLHLRDLQARTGGFTELVPLPFVHMEAPMSLKGLARHGPTFREAVLVHAAARIALYPHFRNIQTSWTKMGVEGATTCLNSGANDLGGTLMSECISRAAGAENGQELAPDRMRRLIHDIGRNPMQRTTLYQEAVPNGALPEAPDV